MLQKIITGIDSSARLTDILKSIGSQRFLLVCDCVYRHLSNHEAIESTRIPHVKFSDFTSNPLYEQVVDGVNVFNREACDAIVAVGGGSTIDVAKCIKLYSRMDKGVNYLEQACEDSGVPLIALPTTAGTGSESTRYAVIYYDKKKQSIIHDSILPEYVILDPSVLISLPLYQKKCTMLDALCQGIESWWSVNSTDESVAYSKKAVNLIMGNWEAYIEANSIKAAEQIMAASNYAGRAINITQTTAAHAMSYKLTSMYKLPHGHAVAICLPHVWRHMVGHMDHCIDKRGSDYLADVFDALGRALVCDTTIDAIAMFEALLRKLDISSPSRAHHDDIDMLTAAVDPVRLKNNPIKLQRGDLQGMYENIIR